MLEDRVLGRKVTRRGARYLSPGSVNVVVVLAIVLAIVATMETTAVQSGWVMRVLLLQSRRIPLCSLNNLALGIPGRRWVVRKSVYIPLAVSRI